MSSTALPAPSFGTSGLRGLVVALTSELVRDYTRAFIQSCPTGGAVHLGWDLRPSSPDIADMVAQAICAEGLDVVRHGALPTPALAMASMAHGQAAIMITGSHIPADRNGLKFYVPEGEISKAQETAIVSALGQIGENGQGAIRDAEGALAAFAERYENAFGSQALEGLRIGVYQHSSVARSLMPQVLAALGAVPVELGYSEIFIPVDTEAVDAETRAKLAEWAQVHNLDAVISSDGDADRPLVADAIGRPVPGDVLGAITAHALGATEICTPVSSNSLIDQMGSGQITRTRIGSPFVIAAMEEIRAKNPQARVVGYEANGGFLLGFHAEGPAGVLPPLMTRDFLLPILVPLALAKSQGQTLAGLWNALPRRFTAADRVKEVPTTASRSFIDRLISDVATRADFFDDLGPEQGMDLTDGLRLRFASGEVVHLRPSGNAPECRCYAEAETAERAEALVAAYMNRLHRALCDPAG